MNFAEISAQKLALDPHEPLVVGFSGGPDSLSLLHALHAAGLHLIVAHLDHALRPESAAEAQIARSLVESLGVPFFERRKDVGSYAAEHSLSLEEAAREIRYRFLFELADQGGAQAVAVAHTADDQAETLLMHLLRGAGLAGLRGMALRTLPNPWSDRIPLIRPLLETSREDVLSYCAQFSLQPLNDPSNTDLRFTRNRIRSELVPLLETFNPEVKGALQRSAHLLAADYKLLEQLLSDTWTRCLRDVRTDYLQLDWSAFAALPLSLQRMLLRRAFYVLRPRERDLGYSAVDTALGILLNEKKAGQQDWLAGLFLLVEGEVCWIADWDAKLPVEDPQLADSEEMFNLEVPGTFKLEGGWWLVADEKGMVSQPNPDPYQAWMDAEAAGSALTIRARRQGDHFQPMGMKGRLKLSDFMINEKIPERARAAWPLVCRGDEILWVPGHRQGESFRVRGTGHPTIHLAVKKIEG